MDFQLTYEQRMIQDLARQFADQEIIPRAAQADRDQAFPMEVQHKALELGLLNLAIPAELGGAGLGCGGGLLSEPMARLGSGGIGGGYAAGSALRWSRISSSPMPLLRDRS